MLFRSVSQSRYQVLTSWRTYKDKDSEIQHQHLATNLIKLIESYGYESTILDNENFDKAIEQIDICDKTNTIGIIKKDSFSKIELEEKHKLDLSHYVKRSDFLEILNDKFKDSDTLFIGTTGNTSREMYSFMQDTNNFYMAVHIVTGKQIGRAHV